MAEFADSVLLIAVVGMVHPKLQKWINDRRIVEVEHVYQTDLDTHSLVFGLNDGKNIAVELPTVPRSGTKSRRDKILLTSIRVALTENVIANIGLQLPEHRGKP